MPDGHRALARAHRFADAQKDGTSLAEIVAETGLTRAYIRGLTRLAYLAPDIQDAILSGRQPVGLTLEQLVRFDIPLDWAEQRRRYGSSA